MMTDARLIARFARDIGPRLRPGERREMVDAGLVIASGDAWILTEESRESLKAVRHLAACFVREFPSRVAAASALRDAAGRFERAGWADGAVEAHQVAADMIGSA